MLFGPKRAAPRATSRSEQELQIALKTHVDAFNDFMSEVHNLLSGDRQPAAEPRAVEPRQDARKRLQ